MNYKDKAAVEKMKAYAIKNKERDEREESLGEPYWDKGHWVFLRTASPTTLDTKIDIYDLNPTTINPMLIHRECDRTCNFYFKKYGKVCGHRYNTRIWHNEYRNFNNICDLEHVNCVEKRKSWHPMHRGECGELKTFVQHPRGDMKPVVERKKKWDPYEYKPPTRKPKPNKG